MLHRPSLKAEIREGDLVPDGAGKLWRTFEPTGRAVMSCICGDTTGFVGKPEAVAQAKAHRVFDPDSWGVPGGSGAAGSDRRVQA